MQDKAFERLSLIAYCHVELVETLTKSELQNQYCFSRIY